MKTELDESGLYGIARWRFVAVLIALGLLLLAILIRLVMLHTVDQPFLFEEGEKRMVRTQVETARRGMITDRFGNPLAVSTPVVDIGLHPAQLDIARLPEIARILGRQPDSIVKTVRDAAARGRSFIYLDRQVEPDIAQAIADLGIDGVQMQEGFRRFYPAAEVASHVVGIVDIDNHGQEGLELAFDEYLSGKDGKRTVVKDRYGHVVKQVNVDAVAESGHDITLTLDLRLQYLAYRELMSAVQTHQASSGSVVILDARTSEILAMVNQGAYNPNNRSSFKASNMRNRAVADVIEPGSTVKPFTVAAALASGMFEPDTKVDTSPGYIRVRSKTIRDHRNYGVLDLTGIITKSSNVGATLISRAIGAKALWTMFSAAGMGQASGLGFPGESVGVLPYPEQLDELRLATASYGYSIAMSPLQLAQSYTSFTQQGCRKSAFLVMEARREEPCQQVMSAQIAREVLDMMETVTSNIGTASRARVTGYRVGGKTGTAHKVGQQGYEDSAYTAVFAGVAPITNPDLVMVVVIDDPQGKEYYGGEVAAPVFGRIMEQALRLRQVPPDNVGKNGLQIAGGPR
jgi:cell division protein FtsI (penicillin-binding protein 3)